MARAARVFNRSDWLRSAQQAMSFVQTTLWNGDKLLATYKDGKTHLNAYLDDYAFLLNASLELLQAEFATPIMYLPRCLLKQFLTASKTNRTADFSLPATTMKY